MFDIGVYAYLRALFSHNNDELGESGILGQPPRDGQTDQSTTTNNPFFGLVISA